MEEVQKKAREEGREAGLEEGRRAERSRLKRELAEKGISLSPETESELFGENDDQS